LDCGFGVYCWSGRAIRAASLRWFKRVAVMTALGRVGLPDDIGPMIASLLFEDNRWINAQRIEVSGGMSI
jgi:NAD(P)-dependent dehydrogenase (short-subunit alcohol dehydrogenase family)